MIAVGIILTLLGLFVVAHPVLWIVGITLIVLGIMHEVAPGNRTHWW